jgi:hypothetical protein
LYFLVHPELFRGVLHLPERLQLAEQTVDFGGVVRRWSGRGDRGGALLEDALFVLLVRLPDDVIDLLLDLAVVGSVGRGGGRGRFVVFALLVLVFVVFVFVLLVVVEELVCLLGHQRLDQLGCVDGGDDLAAYFLAFAAARCVDPGQLVRVQSLLVLHQALLRRSSSTPPRLLRLALLRQELPPAVDSVAGVADGRVFGLDLAGLQPDVFQHLQLLLVWRKLPVAESHVVLLHQLELQLGRETRHGEVPETVTINRPPLIRKSIILLLRVVHHASGFLRLLQLSLDQSGGQGVVILVAEDVLRKRERRRDLLVRFFGMGTDVFAFQPHLVAVGLETFDERVHRDLHHVLAAGALGRAFAVLDPALAGEIRRFGTVEAVVEALK